MTHFLSTGQAADYLDISVDTLNSRIRAGDFPPPDAIIGDRYQGWTRTTIDRWYAKDSQTLYCSPTQVTEVINRIRHIAEDIRGHGHLKGSPGIAAQVPRELYALTGLIESELRRIVTWDHACAKLFDESEAAEADITRIDFDLTPAPSLAVHPNLNLALGEPTLRRAASEIEALAHELRKNLISRPARTFDDTLIEQAAIVRRYADEIHTAAAQHQNTPH